MFTPTVIVPLRLSLWYNAMSGSFNPTLVIVPLRLSLWYNAMEFLSYEKVVIVPLRLSLWYNFSLLTTNGIRVIVPLRLSLWYNTYPKKPAISRIAGFFAFKKCKYAYAKKGTISVFFKKV